MVHHLRFSSAPGAKMRGTSERFEAEAYAMLPADPLGVVEPPEASRKTSYTVPDLVALSSEQ